MGKVPWRPELAEREEEDVDDDDVLLPEIATVDPPPAVLTIGPSTTGVVVLEVEAVVVLAQSAVSAAFSVMLT